MRQGMPPHEQQRGDAEPHGGGHPPPHRRPPPGRRLLRLRGRLPLQHVPVRDGDAVHRAPDRVGGDDRLMRQHHQRHGELLHAAGEILPEGRVVRPPRLVGRGTQRGDGEGREPGEDEGREDGTRPSQPGVGQHRPPRDEPRQREHRRHAAAHVVEHLPARHRRERIHAAAARAGNLRHQPGQELPVAADPAVHPARRGEIARRVVVEHLDVRDQRGARERALDQIVAEQRVLGEATRRGLLERRDVVDPLAGVGAFGEQVLIDVGHRGRVRVHPRMAGEDRRVARAVRAGERHAHARLHDAVAARHPAGGLVEPRAVEGMRHRPDQRNGRVARQHGVGVESDDEANGVQPAELALRDREGLAAAAEHPGVEVGELAALALPAHPAVVDRVEPAWAHEEVEGRRRRVALAVRGVERLHALDSRRDDLGVAGHRLLIGVEEVAEQGEPDLRIGVREILRLEMLERFAHGIDAAEQDRHDDRGAMRRRHLAREVEARQAARWEEEGDELVDDRDGDVGRRHEREPQREQQPEAVRAVERSQQDAERARREQRDGAQIRGARRGVRDVPQAFGDRFAVADRGFQGREPGVDEVVADVRLQRGGTSAAGGGRGGVDRGGGRLELREVAALGEPLHDVAVAVARAEGHRGVDARRIAAEDRLGEARVLDEVAPVDVPDRAQAGDAVRHDERREREALGRALHRLLDAHHVLADPLLQPEERGEVGAAAAHLLQEARQEGRRELARLVDELRQGARERGGRLFVGGEQARHPRVGFDGVGGVAASALGHVPDVLQESHAQHRRHGPQLAHGERGDPLILAHHQLERRLGESAVGMRDQLDRDLVDARIAGEGARLGKLRQLGVVVGRQRGADLGDLRGDDVVVVEQPVAGGADADPLAGDVGEVRVDALEHLLRGVEAREERAFAATPGAMRELRRCGTLAAGELPRMLREPVGAEQLAKDGLGRFLDRRGSPGEPQTGRCRVHDLMYSTTPDRWAAQRTRPPDPSSAYASRGSAAKRARPAASAPTSARVTYAR